MDWRTRNYYLITTDRSTYDFRHELYEMAAPSIKRHSVHNKYQHLRPFNDTIGFIPQEMVSCAKDESESLEYELNKASRRDAYSKWYKIADESRVSTATNDASESKKFVIGKIVSANVFDMKTGECLLRFDDCENNPMCFVVNT